MSRIPYGSVSLATLTFDAKSQCPPPGRYTAMIIHSVDGRAARVLLTAEQAAAVGRWLQPPKVPSAKLKRRAGPAPGAPLQVSAVATDWEGVPLVARGSPLPSATATRSSTTVPSTRAADDRASARPATSEDKLVTGRFITGFRERCAERTTQELDGELATFEPDLARAAGRLVRGTLTGHLGPGGAGATAAVDAVHREVLLLLLSLRGAYADLWHGLMFGDPPDETTDGEEAPPDDGPVGPLG